MNIIPSFEPDFGNEEADACHKYMLSGGYVTEYKHTRELENVLENFINVKHCIMVNNGTISISLALLSVGIKPGDVVIVPNLTMVATANAVTLIGAKPLFVDVNEKTLTIGINELERKLYGVKAVIHVSLNNRSYKLSELRKLCDKTGVKLIEDAAQSLGSFYHGNHLGTFGHIGSFSFSTPKIISTGQGGCLVTNDDELAYKIRRLKDFGRECGGNNNFSYFGINSKFTDIQAVIGIEQMKKMDMRIQRKKEIWQLYQQLLSKIKGVTLLDSTDEQWIPWVIDIYVDKPEELVIFLSNHGILTRLQYPPIHSQNIYMKMDHSDMSVSTKYSTRGVWLSAHHKLSDDQIVFICEKINEFQKS